MFYSHEVLRRPDGEFAILWLAAFDSKKVSRQEWDRINVCQKCEEILPHITYSAGSVNRSIMFSLRLSATLLLGITTVLQKQHENLLRNARALNTLLKTFWKTPAVDKNISMQDVLDPQKVALAIDLPANVSLLDDFYSYFGDLNTSSGMFTNTNILAADLEKENVPMNMIELTMTSQIRSPDEPPEHLVRGPHMVKNIKDITLQEDPPEIIPSHRAGELEWFGDDSSRFPQIEASNLGCGSAEMLQQLFPFEIELQRRVPAASIRDPILTSFDLTAVPTTTSNVLITEPHVDSECVEKESVSFAFKRLLPSADDLSVVQQFNIRQTSAQEQSSILDDISGIQPLPSHTYLGEDANELTLRQDSQCLELSRVVESKHKSSESELLAALEQFVEVPFRHESTSNQVVAPPSVSGRLSTREVKLRLGAAHHSEAQEPDPFVPLGARPVLRNRRRKLANDVRTIISRAATRAMMDSYEDLCKPFTPIAINQSAKRAEYLLNNPARRLGSGLRDLWTDAMSKRFECWAATEKSDSGQEAGSSAALPSVEAIRANTNSITRGEMGHKTSLDNFKSPSGGMTPRGIMGELENVSEPQLPNLVLDQSSVLVENNNESTLATIPEVRETSCAPGSIGENGGVATTKPKEDIDCQSVHTPQDLLRLMKQCIERRKGSSVEDDKANEGERNEQWTRFSDVCPFMCKRNIAARLFLLLVILAKEQLVTVEQGKESGQETATISQVLPPKLYRHYQPIKIRLC